jgi:hypothetical protein
LKAYRGAAEVDPSNAIIVSRVALGSVLSLVEK